MLNYAQICSKIRTTTKAAKSQDAKINAVKRAFKAANYSDSCEYHVEPRLYPGGVDVVVYKKDPWTVAGFVDII